MKVPLFFSLTVLPSSGILLLMEAKFLNPQGAELYLKFIIFSLHRSPHPMGHAFVLAYEYSTIRGRHKSTPFFVKIFTVITFAQSTGLNHPPT